MAELGAGTGTSYDGGLDVDNNQESTNTLTSFRIVNDLAAAVIALETFLGVRSTVASGSVDTYLGVEHDTDGTHGAITPTTCTPDALVMPSGSANITQWPSFSVNKGGSPGGDQSVPASLTKVAWGTEVYDTGGHFESDRYTPIAGKYHLSATVQVNAMDDGKLVDLHIYKNGVSFYKARQVQGVAAANMSVTVSGDVDANGTDYFEIYVLHNGGVFETVDGGITVTHFTGHRVG